MKGLEKVRSIKSLNCSYKNKSREELSSEVYTLGCKFFNKIKLDSFTPAQQLVIQDLNGGSLAVSTCDLQDFYNPITDDATKLETWWKELNAFNYKKYSVNKKSIMEGDRYSDTTHAKEAYSKIKIRIEHFKALLVEADDDLINWSDQKISLRFTKLGIKCKAWEISTFVDTYQKHLLSKGLKRVDKKKSTSKGKLDEIVKGGNATVEDYFRYYKQASPYDASKVLEHLDLEHLYMIIESDLKCVTSKLLDKWDARCRDTKAIAILLCEKSVTAKDYKKIIKWATPNLVTEKFMIKHKDHAAMSEVIEYCDSNSMSTSDYINEEFYQTCLVKIPENVKYTLNTGLTWQYMVRMSDAERISVLKRIVSDEPNNIDHNTLYSLYKDIEYKQIRDKILSSKSLKHYMVQIFINKNDIEAMMVCATTVANHLEGEHKKDIFSRLSYDNKKEVIISDKGRSNYEGAIATLSEDERLDLLSSIIDLGYDSYLHSIFNRLDSKEALRKANKIVSEMGHVDRLSLSNIVIDKLSVETKKVLLERDICLLNTSIYYGYSNSRKTISDSLGYAFFNDFRKEDTKDVPHYCQKHIAHTMSKEDLERRVSIEIGNYTVNTNKLDLKASFFRLNLDLLGYGFLRQFKEKKLFRLVVGDQRDSCNKKFGEKLFSKLNVSQSIDFMFS